MSLVVAASIGLKWVLDEPDSHWAEALARADGPFVRDMRRHSDPLLAAMASRSQNGLAIRA